MKSCLAQIYLILLLVGITMPPEDDVCSDKLKRCSKTILFDQRVSAKSLGMREKRKEANERESKREKRQVSNAQSLGDFHHDDLPEYEEHDDHEEPESHEATEAPEYDWDDLFELFFGDQRKKRAV